MRFIADGEVGVLRSRGGNADVVKVEHPTIGMNRDPTLGLMGCYFGWAIRHCCWKKSRYHGKFREGVQTF